MAATYLYSGLRSLYGGFRAPAWKILSGNAGTDLEKTLGCRIQNLKVALSEKQDETAEFDVGGMYDLASHSIDKTKKDALKPGTKIEVQAGYGSQLETVFKGYIDHFSLRMSEEDSFSCHVTAADVKKLLREGGTRRRVFHDTTYTGIFKTVLLPYAGLCAVETGAETPGSEFTLNQKTNDFDFIEKKIIGEGLADWNLRITGGTASLKPAGLKVPLMELGPGSGLKSFDWSYHFLNKKIVVQGFTYLDPDGIIEVEGEVKESFLDSSVMQVMEFIPAGNSTEKGLKKILDGKMQEYKSAARRGSLSCIGLPELKPGELVALKDMDSDLNQKYEILEVSHSIGEDGFVTNLTIGGT